MHNVWHDRGFRIHLIVYAAVNLLLLAINLLTDRGHLWFYWQPIGWGLALLGSRVPSLSSRSRRLKGHRSPLPAAELGRSNAVRL